MLSNRLQQILSSVSLRAGFEMDGGGTRSRRYDLTASSRLAAALGLVSREYPLGADLLIMVYTDDIKPVKEAAYEYFAGVISPTIAEASTKLHTAMVDLALAEINFLAGSKRCGCRGRKPECEHCHGSGVRPNKPLSERNRVAMLGVDGVNRHVWRDKLQPVYERLLDALLDQIHDASIALNKQYRAAEDAERSGGSTSSGVPRLKPIPS